MYVKLRTMEFMALQECFQRWDIGRGTVPENRLATSWLGRSEKVAYRMAIENGWMENVREGVLSKSWYWYKLTPHGQAIVRHWMDIIWLYDHPGQLPREMDLEILE